MLRSALIGAGANAAITYAEGGSNYEIIKSATSGAFSGAILAFGGNSVGGILAAGGVSGGVGELVNQAFDNVFGNGKEYDLKAIVISAGIGTVANYVSSNIVDQLSAAVDKQLAKSLESTETSVYRKVIRKAILDKNPRIGSQQLKKAINQDIKTVQGALRKDAAASKIALTQAVERGTDYIQEKVNDATKPKQ
jgi:hypothetical protein